jgi:hypothetical protein
LPLAKAYGNGLKGFLFCPTFMDVFDQFIPPPATEYARQLHVHYPFRFRVVPPRRSRFGDFRVLPGGQVQITVNADLSPPAFLLTYVHEMAHRLVYQQYTEQIKAKPTIRKRPPAPKPHGPEWQQTFQQLMTPLLTEAVFPSEILAPLRRYMSHPGATLSRHPELARLLRPVVNAGPLPVLGQLVEGQVFRLGKKSFVRGKQRRSRIVCEEVATGRRYAILAEAPVEPHE